MNVINTYKKKNQGFSLEAKKIYTFMWDYTQVKLEFYLYKVLLITCFLNWITIFNSALTGRD